MGFWVLLGFLTGAFLGSMAGGMTGAVVLSAIGAVLGGLIARSVEPARPPAGSGPPPAPRYGPRTGEALPAPASPDATRGAETLSATLLERLDAIDARLARIEASLVGESQPRQVDAGSATAPDIAAHASPTSEAPAAAGIALPPEDSVAEPPGARAAAAATQAALAAAAARQWVETGIPFEASHRAAGVDGAHATGAADAASAGAAPSARAEATEAPADSTPPPRPRYGAAPSEVPPPAPAQHDAARAQSSSLPLAWRWLTGGNALTRVGIVILFFGVAFLLTYFAEIVTVPIEIKLASAAAGGLALAGLGVVLARRRPAYGLSLQGAGMGIVYLVVFAAFRLYEALSPATAIALLVAVAVTTTVLALRHSSQPLAALAQAGGFLAPVLIRTEATDPALLLGYFAILNAVIFALAWRQAWRGLNVLGFVFTFVLGLAWGWRFYAPAHYAVVQPFLVLFFLFYVAIAILYARRGALDARAPVDGLLVFGVPIVGFALQVAIARGYRYGVAISAATLAAFYAGLWLWLRGGGVAERLARSFAVLAVVFATLAIPFAFDARVTSASWAVEGAAVYWLGAAQRQPLARAFALIVQVAAAIAFGLDADPGSGRPLLNATFFGMVMIGLAGLASAWAADRHRDALAAHERVWISWLFVWGAAWWTLGGVVEMREHLERPASIDAALAWVTFTTGVALSVSRLLGWPRLLWITALLLPAMALAAIADLEAVRTTLTHYGWLVWPIAWGLQWYVLRAGEALLEVGDEAARRQRVRSDFLHLAHTLSTIALVVWVAWEASEWAGRMMPAGTVWIACAAALPATVYLYLASRLRGSARWPFDRHAEAYGASVGTTLAALLVVWFLIVNVVSPGDPAPLPYLPLANPLDLVLIAALFALSRWSQTWSRIDADVRYAWLGAGAFVMLNATVVRTAHHWGDVPWRWTALVQYKPLLAALTLTWTVAALALMLWATRRSVRAAWMVGAALLFAVVVKLFAMDLAALAGLTRVIAFMGVGALLLVIGYVAPLPPADERPPASS